MALSERAQKAAAVAFPDKPARDVVLTALERYSGPERQRVQLAILVLASRDVEALEQLIDDANLDYRDVLYWAEYPEDAGTGTRAAMAGKYRELGLPVPRDLA
jgi:hypothetical protein